jgi:hypothetical protein
MTKVVLDLDIIEEEVLKKLLDMGLFETPQEAFRIALLKYAMDLSDTSDADTDLDPNMVRILDKLALGEQNEEQAGEETDEEQGAGEG